MKTPLLSLPSPLLCSLLVLLAAPPVAADFQATAKLVGSQAAAHARFGQSVDTDGVVTVVGASHYTDPPSAPGSVTVYRGCAPPVEEAVLHAGDASLGDSFGYAVAVDGDRILVGAPALNFDTLEHGAAYVFHFDGTQWLEEAKLVAPNGMGGDRFGFAVDLDGGVAVVGAPAANAGKGRGYAFRFDGAQWNLWNELENIEVFVPTSFGYSLALDGARLVVGAPYHPDEVYGWGRVHTFEQSDLGFGFRGVTPQPDEGPNQGDDTFGASVGLDGDALLVGAPRFDGTLGGDQGLVYAFRWGGAWPDPAWLLTERIEPDALAAGDELGWTLDLDGGIAVASAYHDDGGGTDAGAAYVLKRGSLDEWVVGQELAAPDGAAGDLLWSAAVRGGTIALGVPRDDDAGTDSGSVHVFRDPFPTYGAGAAGVPGDPAPSVTATGGTAPGETLALELRDFTGGSVWVWVMTTEPGYAPSFSGALYLDLSVPYVLKTGGVLPGAPGAPGEGDLDVPVAVPPGVGYACANLYLQFFGVDPALDLPAMLSSSNGLVLSFE